MRPVLEVADIVRVHGDGFAEHMLLLCPGSRSGRCARSNCVVPRRWATKQVSLSIKVFGKGLYCGHPAISAPTP